MSKMLFLEKFVNEGPSPKNFSGIDGEILETQSQNYDPQKSLKLGTNSGEILENFQGIIHKNLFSRNSSEILKSKSPKLENLGKFLPFVN